MKNIKSMAALALAATVMLASCGKEEVGGGNDGDGTTSVKIALSYPENTNTRAEGSAATAGEASFKPGHILFVTGSGLIDTHVTVGKTTPISGVTNFTLAELTESITTSEVVVEGVSSSATACYILSNDEAVFTGTDALSGSLEGTNISQVLAKVMAVSAMLDDTAPLDQIPMYGTGTVSTATTGTTTGGKAYTATVDVPISSLGARLQIGKISAADYTPANGDVVKITAFTVDGIYLNNVNPTMSVAGTLGAIVENGATVTNYTKAGTTPYSTTGSLTTLVDEPALAAADASGVLTADQTTATNHWVYNVFPQANVTGSAPVNLIPHVIIKLSGVKYKINDGAEVAITPSQWLTVTTYKDAANAPVEAFAANNIYTLNDIAFDFSDLKDIPYATDLDVLVTVQMFDWVNNDISWNN